MGRFNEYPRVSLYECRCANCGWTSIEVFKNRLYDKECHRRGQSGGRVVVWMNRRLRVVHRSGLGGLYKVSRRKVGGRDWKGVLRRVKLKVNRCKVERIVPPYKRRRQLKEELERLRAQLEGVEGDFLGR